MLRIARDINNYVRPDLQIRIDKTGGQNTQSLQSNITTDKNKY